MGIDLGFLLKDSEGCYWFLFELAGEEISKRVFFSSQISCLKENSSFSVGIPRILASLLWVLIFLKIENIRLYKIRIRSTVVNIISAY